MKSFEQLAKEYYEPAPKEDVGSLLFEMVEDVIEQNQRLEEMASLSYPELDKYQYRLGVLVNKVKAGEPFVIEKTGEEVYLLSDPDFVSSLELVLADFIKTGDARKAFTDNYPAASINKYGTPIFPVDQDRSQSWDGDFISLRNLKKTEDFGGEQAGKRLSKEAQAMSQLGDIIGEAIQNNDGNPLTLVVPNKDGGIAQKFTGVVGMEGIAGDPKADFKIVRAGGLPSIYISHKAGATVKSFGQWSGVSRKAGSVISEHPEVVEFERKLKANIGISDDGKYYMPRRKTYVHKIVDQNLKYLAVFGPNYSREGEGGIDNVDYVAQGNFRLTPYQQESGSYVLDAVHLYARATFEGDFGPLYEPALIARFATARRSFDIVGCRSSIYPYGGRKIAYEFVDDALTPDTPLETEED